MVSVDLDAVRREVASLTRAPTAVDVADSLRRLGVAVSDVTVRSTLDALRRESFGAGPLDPLLRMPGVTDVLVNGPSAVLIDRGQGLERVPIAFESDEHVRRLAVRIAAQVGRRLDEGSPFVDGRLPDGTRVHAVLGSLTDCGTCLSLRLPPRQAFSVDDWVQQGSLSPSGAELLRALVASRAAFLVSGGTGSGKTTLLASLLGEVPSSERIVIVEDSRELNPQHSHCVRLEARPPNAEGSGEVTLADLVRQALRMRPDRLIVGEVRGSEVGDLLNACNTGHEGGAGTIHANSASDTVARLEALASLAGLTRPALHAQVAAGLDAVVHVRRGPGGRRFVEDIHVFEVNPASGMVHTVPAVTMGTAGELRRGAGFDRLAHVLGPR